jgi:hypothetical protein
MVKSFWGTDMGDRKVGSLELLQWDSMADSWAVGCRCGMGR